MVVLEIGLAKKAIVGNINNLGLMVLNIDRNISIII
jgi:hypothetical protein